MADDINKRIAKAQANARRKMTRIRKTQKYDIAKTPNNPITGNTESMSPTQKRTYLRKLERFNSKSTRFYVDAHGKPVSQRTYEAYKRAEARANAHVKAELKKYGKLKLPNSNATIQQHNEMIGKNKPGKLMVNPSGSNMHLVDRASTAFDSENAVRRMTKSQQDKANPAKQRKRLKTNRKQFEDMVKDFGDKEMIEEAKSLTDSQFNILWNYTDFATAISLGYEMYLQRLRGEELSFHATGFEKVNQKAKTFVEWAKGL